MIYVQHLLGAGHLKRALELANALAQSNFRVELVSGGMPLPREPSLAHGVHLLQLSPVRSADGNFTRLLDGAGNEIDAAWKDSRKQALLQAFENFLPAVLITETFPFGRRMMRFELLPLLEMAQADPGCVLVIASIRDILQPKSSRGRNDETCALIDRFYDHVIVHGDENIAALEHSFDLAGRIGDKLSYSGYICSTDTAPAPGDDGQDEVLVSAGSSATGLQILETAILSKPLSRLAHLRWRILVSPSIADAEFHGLEARAGDGIIVERNRADFTALVARARLTISQAGYNTITDILRSDTAAVVIPYAEAGEVEQTLRAGLLHERGRVVMLEQARLSPATLAAAIEQACLSKPALTARLDGAARSVALIDRWLADSEIKS